MNKYKDLIERINYGLFLTVVALLPFPQTPLRYACVLWIATWFLELRWLKISNIKYPISKIKSLPFILFGLWFVWQLVSGFWAPDHTAWARQMERYLAFGLLVPVALWGVNSRYDWRQAAKVLVISCVIAVPVYILWMAALYHHPEWVTHLPLTEEWIHHEQWSIFLPENISHFKHRLFLCSVELTGVICAWLLYRNQWRLFLPAVLVMLSSIPLTGSRQSVITVIVLAALLILFSIPKTTHRLWYGIGVTVVGVVLLIGFLKTHPRMQDVQIRDLTEMREMSYDHDIRYNIWGAALQHPSDYLAYGLGAGQSQDYLAERYADVHFDYYAQKRYHAHNQYLEVMMELGIPGLILFLAAWLSIPLCTKKKGRQTAILFTSLFMLNMFTDCMFGKFCGIALWAVGLMLIFLQSDTERDEQTSWNTETH